MAMKPDISAITNPLVTSTQLLHFKSSSIVSTPSSHFATFLLTQAAGIFLRLPQETIATAIVLLQRYLISSASSPIATSTTNGIESTKPNPELAHLSAAALYLSAKLSSIPTSPRNLINVYAFLTSQTSSPLPFISPSARTSATTTSPPDPSSHYVSEGALERHRLLLFQLESRLLISLAFNTNVSLPHPLALTYLTLLFPNQQHTELTTRVLSHLNTALLSPNGQYLYLTHQPTALAVAAIYLAARELQVKIPVGECNWWEVFDVGREELGFCVVGMLAGTEATLPEAGSLGAFR
ncbi:Cyclin-L2 [Cyphellophora attinorum]|uniref:Cyclin-L2 n=1 Tax=Cyphellophora attinorum TaxID=1664694 RepID=A0A0N0NND3_9EURO|nr:Cyclin-L2 [Phialophora attinorum]KPI41481.1 Cyclin-L2 [Phialophora attinorum]